MVQSRQFTMLPFAIRSHASRAGGRSRRSWGKLAPLYRPGHASATVWWVEAISGQPAGNGEPHRLIASIAVRLLSAIVTTS
jgi:hypothetical protein